LFQLLTSNQPGNYGAFTAPVKQPGFSELLGLDAETVRVYFEKGLLRGVRHGHFYFIRGDSAWEFAVERNRSEQALQTGSLFESDEAEESP
jgi:hypothetical protein